MTKGSYIGDEDQLHRLQIMFGLNYNADGLLFDPELKGVFEPTRDIYYDHMHSLMGSGGMGQYAINLFILRTLRHGFTLEAIDEFQQKVVWPRGSGGQLSAHFFRKRVVPNKKGRYQHLKAFANECIIATRTCKILCEVVLLPRNILADECECILLLNKILDLLMQGDAAVQHARRYRVSFHTQNANCPSSKGASLIGLPILNHQTFRKDIVYVPSLVEACSISETIGNCFVRGFCLSGWVQRVQNKGQGVQHATSLVCVLS